MLFSSNTIVHKEVIDLKVPPYQVRDFIMTPERILDYYPAPIDGGVIEKGSSIYCRGKSGISLLELVHSQSSDQLLVVKVTTATNIQPPFTVERIKSATFFTMIEHWEIIKTKQGVSLTKTWRDIKKKKLKFLPMGFIVRKSAKAETDKLRTAWNKQAR